MLKGSTRRYLRGLAHKLSPAVKVGKAALSDGVADSLDRYLTAHELMKVQIRAEREEREVLAQAIEERLGCECVGTIGRMAIFYREHPDPECRKITLPDD